MQKRQSFCVVALFSVALSMTAGCATQDVVKKDEGLVPVSTAKQADQSKTNTTQPKQSALNAASQITPAKAAPADQPAQKASTTSQLQNTLEKIYFDFDSANLSESSRSALSKNAAVLAKASTAKIRIEGNCDERGSAEYNLALGERRAKSAQQYLIALGVKSERLSTISYGKEKPAAPGSDEAAMAKNRRDEFVTISQ